MPPDTTKVMTFPPITGYCKDTLLQMQRTVHSARKSQNDCSMEKKTPHHELDTFTHINSLLYKMPWTPLRNIWH